MLLTARSIRVRGQGSCGCKLGIRYVLLPSVRYGSTIMKPNSSLMYSKDVVLTEVPNLKVEAIRFYSALFTTCPSHVGWVLKDISTSVTVDMTAQLLRPYSGDEVRTYLFQMHPTKSLRPDGFPSLFYHRY